MNIALSPDLEKRIQEKLDSGVYDSVNSLIGEALELLDERDAAYSFDIASARSVVRQSMAEIDSGQGIEGQEFFQRLLKRGT